MFDQARLERLANAYFDKELTAEEKRELEAILLGSARARRIFLDYSEWHGLTREWALRSQGESLMADFPPTRRTAGRSGHIVALVAGLAACLLLGWWLMPERENLVPSLTEEEENPLRDDVALLAQAIDVEWEAGTPARAVGTALSKGMLKIRKGTLRLDFYSGARVILEGPAAIDLLSQDLARLHQGKLTARVPPPAEGFTILNSDLRVVDRGTEFGMNVQGDNCEVHVFDGEVELQGNVPLATERALFGGEAISIRRGKSQVFAANRLSFVDPASMVRAAARETTARLKSWRARSAEFRKSSDLLIYFNFENLAANNVVLENRAAGAAADTDGSVIGCEILSGRWSKKTALGFAKTSDRVRFRAQGTTPSATFIAWIRVDSLPQDHNSLLSMSPDRVGEIHWKLDRSGRLLLGMRATDEFTFDSWERLVSPPIVTEQDFGRWMQLATVIDGEQGVMKHFVNGEEVASAPMTHRTEVQLGLANLGNFDAASPDRLGNVVRSFNGRIDEFALFERALDAEEIAEMR
jgi:hypothetical protein